MSEQLAMRLGGGLARAVAEAASGSELLVAVDGRVEGLPILDAPARSWGRDPESRFQLASTSVEFPGGRAASRGTIEVVAAGVGFPDWAGASVRVVGRLRGRVLSTHAACVRVMGPAPGLGAVVARVRARALEVLRERFAGPPLGVAVALVLGPYDYLPGPLLREHADTGALPFLAISGSHVALVAIPLRWVFGRAPPRRRRAAVVGLVLAAYAAFVGNASPVTRAMMSFCFAVAAEAFGRPFDGLTALATAVCAELLWRPSEAVRPGFQLSYGAVLAFLLCLRGADRALAAGVAAVFAPRVAAGLAWIRKGTALALVASLSSLGFTAWHFGQVTPGAILVNLPLMVLVPPLMVLGWLSLAPGFLGSLCAGAFVAIEGWERSAVSAIASLPGSPLPVSPWLAPALAAAALALLASLRGAFAPSALFAAAAPLFLAFLPRPPTGALRIVVHEVGHGLAVTVVLPNGEAAQIDAGARDAGELVRRRLAPALDRLGVRSFAAASLSHDDADHGNAFPELLDRFPARLRLARADSACAREWLGTRDREALELAAAGAHLAWIPIATPTASGSNDREIVTLATFAGRRALVPGDLEREGVEALLRAMPTLRVDVAVLPHHGLDNGQIERFLDALSPAVALASCGARDSLLGAERACRERGVVLLATRTLGSLDVTIARDGSMAVRTARAPPPPTTRGGRAAPRE